MVLQLFKLLERHSSIINYRPLKIDEATIKNDMKIRMVKNQKVDKYLTNFKKIVLNQRLINVLLLSGNIQTI